MSKKATKQNDKSKVERTKAKTTTSESPTAQHAASQEIHVGGGVRHHDSAAEKGKGQRGGNAVGGDDGSPAGRSCAAAC